jgi:hypothetical protein
MDIYIVDFDSSWTYDKFIKHPELSELNFNWAKQSFQKKPTSTQAEEAEQAELEAIWKSLSIEEAILANPNRIEQSWSDRTQTLTYPQLRCVYQHCSLKQIIAIPAEPLVDLDKLSDLIVTKLTPLLTRN